jgi:CRISPR-associated protein Cas6
VASAAADEAGFMHEVEAELQQLGVPCRPICGRQQTLEAGTLQGFSLMLDGLSAAAALQLLQRGLGLHRRLGCGLFVPHRSAAAVGTPTDDLP